MTHREDCTRCSDLMLPGLTLVYILRPKKRMKTLIQDKLLNLDQLPPGSSFILEKALNSHLPFSLVSPYLPSQDSSPSHYWLLCFPSFAQKIRTKGKDLFFLLLLFLMLITREKAIQLDRKTTLKLR